MSSLAFIILHSAKNRLLELRRKPGKLILYIIVILVFGGMLAITLLSNSEIDSTADIVYLKGIIFAFFLLFFVTAVLSGLSQGSSLFGMEDVNFLFVSPVNPRSILLYGIFRIVKTMALTSVFILFQGSTLRTFGVGAGGLGILYAGYLLTQVVSQFLSLFIYSVTNGRKNRQRLVKIFSVLIFIPLISVIIRQFWMAHGDFIGALRGVLNSPVFSYTPITGWASEGIVAFMTGDAAAGALFFGLLFMAGAVSVAVIYIGKPDYYEDVLVASETMFEQKRNLTEGKINSLEQISKRKVRIKGTGVGGQGASALFYKHLRESFRANRFGLWGIPTIMLAGGAAIFSLIMRQAVGTEENTGIMTMCVVLGVMAWLQIFMVGTGRGLKETYCHYIYMIPESPFKKMVWSNLEVMLKASVEGAVICLSAGLIAGVGGVVIALSAAVYALFVFMLIAVNFVSMRFTGADVSAGLLIMLYMFAVLLVMLPGVILAVIVGGTVLGIPGALIVLSCWELIIALGGFWAAKGVLHNCDITVLRQMGE